MKTGHIFAIISVSVQKTDMKNKISKMVCCKYYMDLSDYPSCNVCI